MKLSNALKSLSQATLLANKTSVLQVNNKLSVDAAAIQEWCGPDSHMYLCTDDHNVQVGIADVVFDAANRKMDVGLFVESDLAGALVAILDLMKVSGMSKINVLVDPRIASPETLRDAGLVPEVRLRQHLFVDGRLVSIVSYGGSDVELASKSQAAGRS